MQEFSNLNGYGVKDAVARQQIVNNKTELQDLILAESKSRADGDNEQSQALEIAKTELQTNIKLISNYITPQQFGAVANGETDDTKAIQDALNYAVETGVYHVYLPSGKYLISSQIIVPKGVQFTGNNPDNPYLENGTWLYITDTEAGSNTPTANNAGTIVLQNGCIMDGFVIYYPNQLKPDATEGEFTVYRPSIFIKHYGVTIKNIIGVNPYIFVQSQANGGKYLFENIWIHPLSIGFNMYWGGETNRYRNITINPNVTEQYTMVLASMYYKNLAKATNIGMRIYGHDWGFFSDIMFYGCGRAVDLLSCVYNSVEHGCRHFTFDSCGFGWCNVDVRSVSETQGLNNNIAFTGCHFNNEQSTQPAMILKGLNNLIITDCTFRCGGSVLQYDNTVKSDSMIFSNNDITIGGLLLETSSEIFVLHTDNIIFSQNKIKASTPFVKGIYLHPNFTTKAIITENIFSDWTDENPCVRQGGGTGLIKTLIIDANIFDGTSIPISLVNPPTYGYTDKNAVVLTEETDTE